MDYEVIEPDMHALRAEMEGIFGEDELDRLLAVDPIELDAYLANNWSRIVAACIRVREDKLRSDDEWKRFTDGLGAE